MLVRLGEINNGEPVDVALVVMAPKTANILSARLADAGFIASWGPLLRIYSKLTAKLVKAARFDRLTSAMMAAKAGCITQSRPGRSDTTISAYMALLGSASV